MDCPEVPASVRDALAPDPALAEKVIGAQTLAQTPVFVAERLEVQTADGARAPRFIARHHGGVGVVAVREGSVCLVRQYRCALGRVTLEIPAGRLEPGEEPHAAAARELAEETGLVASDLRHLVRVYGSPGFTDEKTDVFLATGLAQGPACPDEGGVPARGVAACHRRGAGRPCWRHPGFQDGLWRAGGPGRRGARIGNACALSSVG